MAYALATRIERAVKKAGVKYRTVSGWKSRGRAAMGSIQSIMCHHTAGPASGNSPSLNVVTYGRPGLSGPLSQLFLARDGTVIIVAAGRSNHAGRVSSNIYSNSHSIGIEAEATGTSSWPSGQIDAYAKLCKALINEFGLSSSRVVGHKEAGVPRGRKIDPNFSMPDFRRKIDGAKGGVSQGGGSSGGKTYIAVSKTAPLGLYDKDGNGHTRVADWQKDALGYTGKDDDGYFGPGTEKDTKALQKQIGLKGKDVDGVVGNDTIAAWEKAGKPKLKKSAPSKPKPSTSKAPKFPLPDGHWYGEESSDPRNHSGYYKSDQAGIRKWQTKMKDRGWSIAVDGIFGPGSAKVASQFQREKGLRVDNAVGRETWDATWEEKVT